MARRLKQGTPLHLPAPSLATELFHFEWVMCDTCDKWRHLRLSPPEYWDVQLRSTWSCGTRVGFDEYGQSYPTMVRAEACAVPQVTWKNPAPAAALPLPGPPPTGSTASRRRLRRRWSQRRRRGTREGGGAGAAAAGAAASGSRRGVPLEADFQPVGSREPMRPGEG